MLNPSFAHAQMSVARFESPTPSLDRWGHGSNPRFLRRRPRNGWRRRDFRGQLPGRSAERQPSRSWWRQGIEAGLFGTYFVVFLASLWMLG